MNLIVHQGLNNNNNNINIHYLENSFSNHYDFDNRLPSPNYALGTNSSTMVSPSSDTFLLDESTPINNNHITSTTTAPTTTTTNSNLITTTTTTRWTNHATSKFISNFIRFNQF